jgi:hypothetical protein
VSRKDELSSEAVRVLKVIADMDGLNFRGVWRQRRGTSRV